MSTAIAVVVLIVAIILLAFGIVNIVYIVRVYNGYVLSEQEKIALIVINVILSVLALVVLICGIVWLIRSRNQSLPDVDDMVMYQNTAAAQVAAQQAAVKATNTANNAQLLNCIEQLKQKVISCNNPVVVQQPVVQPQIVQPQVVVPQIPQQVMSQAVPIVPPIT